MLAFWLLQFGGPPLHHPGLGAMPPAGAMIPAAPHIIAITVWALAFLLVRSSARPGGWDYKHRLLAFGFGAGSAREAFAAIIEIPAVRKPALDSMLGLVPAFEAWLQGITAIVLIAGFLTYLSQSRALGRTYLKYVGSVYVVFCAAAFAALTLAPGRHAVLGLPKRAIVDLFWVAGLLAMLAGAGFTLRLSPSSQRRLMLAGIGCFALGGGVRLAGQLRSAPWMGPPFDLPAGSTATAIGAVLFGYLFARARSTEVRADIRTLEEQVLDRTAHLEAALEELSVANSKLVEQSTIDSLTGVYNRRYFDEALHREWARASREGASLAVALVDLDRFKEINDRHGHPRGDECLLSVATLLQGRLRRPGDVAARYGGDEFAVLLPNTTAEGALQALEGVRGQIESLIDGAAAGLTVSVGVAACVPNGSMGPGRLMQRADESLYAAKEAGRNCVVSGECEGARAAKAG